MIINYGIAKSIVTEINTIINEDINFIDKNGIIIYSTDKERISTFHEAGFICVKDNIEIIVKNPNVYQGTRPGINMPVIFKNEVIGAIGVTGTGNHIVKYSSIIKKMTEILIKENYNQTIETRYREGIKYYIEGLIHGNSIDKEFDFSDKFEDLMTLAVGQNYKSHISIEYTEGIYDILNKYLYSKDCIYAVFFNEIVIYSFNMDLENFYRQLEMIINDINSLTGYSIKFGISESFRDIELSKYKYKEACIALNWGKLLQSSNNFYEYNNFDLEILLTSVDKESLNKYRNRVLSNIDESDFEIYKNLISTYVNNNGSIEKCSKDLFVHKNTVQYRLNKLASITNYNPRKLNDLVRLYIAFMITSSSKMIDSK
ncbi:CdaR family transcriptional regulator [Anaerococcus cruorum]|uniref:CdaR family transcriptional regulator n=1 Tax=Anaerococcus sp. WGS1596 TaxID=3366806 RepID=UPI00372D7A1B